MKPLAKEFLPPEHSLAERIFTIPQFQYPDKINIVRSLYEHVSDWNRIAIYHEDEEISFSKLRQRTNQLANALTSLGIEENDRVMVTLPNCPEFLYAYYACWTIGAIVVVAPNLLRKEEIVYRANDSEAKAFIVSSDRWPDLEEVAPQLNTVDHIIVAGERRKGYLFYDDVISGQSQECEIADTDKYHSALLLYSSGTTGRPKGIIQDSVFLFVSGDSSSRIAGSLDEHDVIGGAPPFTFPLGSSFPHIQARTGCAISIIDRPTGEEMFQTVEKHRITVLMNVPSYTFGAQLYEDPTPETG
ncbi:MAG: long-chain fatty acid--CoA ligase, partial [Syntrophales bacterium LBB04]|nr:long-chain fatty acid--CoA ligase [Syntrophales bacterium LBB04]